MRFAHFWISRRSRREWEFTKAPWKNAWRFQSPWMNGQRGPTNWSRIFRRSGNVTKFSFAKTAFSILPRRSLILFSRDPFPNRPQEKEHPRQNRSGCFDFSHMCSRGTSIGVLAGRLEFLQQTVKVSPLPVSPSCPSAIIRTCQTKTKCSTLTFAPCSTHQSSLTRTPSKTKR